MEKRLQKLVCLLLILCMAVSLLPAAALAAVTEYRMTLNSEGVTRSDGWSDSSATGSTSDAKSVYGKTVGASVTFTPPSGALEAGNYEVFYWYLTSQQETMKMTAVISAGGQSHTVTPGTTGTNGWVSLGTYAFAGNGTESLKFTITTAGTWSRVADVKFVPVSGETEPDTSGEIIIEAENAYASNTGTWSEVTQRKGTGSDGHDSFTFAQAKASGGQTVSFTLSVAKAGLYRLSTTTKDNPDRAIFQFSVNGTDVGTPVDLYSANTGGEFREHAIGLARLNAGENTLTATLTGRNPANTGANYGGAFDYFRLTPVEGGTGEVLYSTSFDTLPDGLASGWELVPMKEGYALQGTCSGNTALLAQVTEAGTLPEAYTLVVDMALMEKVTDAGYSGGLTFQHTDSTHFYHFRLDDGVKKNAQLYQWSSSARKHGEASASIEAGEARRLRVTVNGTDITCYLDGQKVTSYTSTSSVAGGNVGFRIYNAKVLFDNLTVYSGVLPPTGDDTAQDFVFPELPGVIYNNEDSVYSEVTGTWAAVAAAGQNGSDARVAAAGGTASFSTYPPSTGNFAVDWYVPAADGAAVNVTVSTLDGMWKYTVPANTPVGWYRLGVVSATTGTAFTLDAASAGRLYADAMKLTPTTDKADAVYTPTGGDSTEIAVLVNQIGYDTGTSKRATVPNAADGTPFQVINNATKAVAFTGTVQDGVADFTALNTESDTDFYITCESAQSYVFTIGVNLIQRRSVVNALAFMNEVRSDTFCVGANSIAWRDSHQFSFELNGLVLQYMANPALYDNLPYSIVSASTCEYKELRVQDEPDIVWLMQFAALRYYDWGHNQGKKLHMLTKEQLAYFLYIYPEISQYVEKETYEAIRDYTISVWGENACNVQWYAVTGTNHDLYSVQTVFGGLKGSQPPGHSIVPNLLMYEVAKRDGLGDDVAQRFFQAACDNCAYTIDLTQIDINDPFYNKGQRMSEYITIPALAYFLEMYPDQAPAGLKTALQRWAATTIARSDNMWDIRMAVSMAAGDSQYYFHNPTMQTTALSQDYWTGAAYANADKQAEYLSGGAPRNEPGNQAGLQAVTYAAARVLNDPATTERLKELGVAAIDDLFGRNPSGRAAFYHFTRDFEGADLGWYKQYAGGAGVLEGHTAVIDANAPEACYPYNPSAYNSGYTEGWVAYNTAWNASLAYAAADAVSVSAPASGKIGDKVTLTLNAPVNLDTTKAETAYVVVTDCLTGESQKVTVTEQGTDSAVLTCVYELPETYAVEVSYGTGLFRHSTTITVTDFESDPLESVTVTPESQTLGVGETFRLTAVVLPATANNQTLTWTSNNPAVATVENGLVTAKTAGTATITATGWDGKGDSCEITVTAARPVSLQVSAPSSLSYFGEPGRAEVTGVTYSDGTLVTAVLPQATFSSSDSSILAVTDKGVLTPVAAGSAVVIATATVDGVSVTGNTNVTVTAQKSFDLLSLYRAGKYTASGVTLSVATPTNDSLTGSYGLDRLKLSPSAAGDTVSFQLGEIPAGTYQVTLYTKYYGTTPWDYGTWSFRVNEQAAGGSICFNDAEKNGFYFDVKLGDVTLTGGETTFTFVSVDGKPLVPVSLKLERTTGESPEPDPEPELTPITKLDELYKKTYTGANGSLNYRMYIPANYDSTKAYPVLIYLNGAGSRGTDNEKQLNNLSPLITPLIGDEAHACIMIVPQLPTSDKWVNVDWANGCYSADVAESKSCILLMGLIGELEETYSVDEDRIYLMGQSFGGYGTWDLITRHPETFAAAIPMAGAGCTARADQIKNMPLLVLHGVKDPTVPVAGSRDMVAAVKAAGNTSITYLEYAADDHYVQRRVFEQPELWLDWLFAQSKRKTPMADDTSDCYFPVVTVNALTQDQKNGFTVSGGTLTATSGGEGKLTLTPNTEKSSVLALWGRDAQLADGQLTAHLTMDSLTGSGGAGLVFRAQDEKNYVHVRFTKDGLQYLEFVNGTSQNAVTVPYTLTGNRITCMKAILEGKHVKIYVDNTLLIERDIQAAALQKSGKIGLRSYAVPVTADDLIWAEKDQSTPAIRLTTPTERQVIQRDLATKSADVAVTGEVKNAAKVLLRVTQDGTVKVDWSVAETNGATFSKTLTLPQGGWYTLEAKAVDENDTELASACVTRFGVGMNILCIGQSNMVGIGQGGTAAVADDRVSNFMNETWSHLVDPYAQGDTSPNLTGQTCGNSMVPSLANALVEAYDIPVGILPAAMGGSNLLTSSGGYPHWLDRNEQNIYDRTTLYGNSLYRVREAGGVELIVMNQGENNVSTNTDQADYLAGLQQLLANYRMDLHNSSLPLFYCQLGPAKPGSWTAAAKDDVMDGIRAAQLQANDPENGLILAAMEMDMTRNSDNLHYTTDSQKILGARVANAILWYYDETAGKTDYYMGPAIIGARFADGTGKVIDVTVAHTGGTDFTPSANITGFVVRDGGQEAEIVSAVRKDANTIRLTLAEAVSSSAVFRYCKGLLPDVTGIVRDNSPMQLPLNITPGWLPVQEAPHQHNPTHIPEKTETCTQDGNIEYWYCAGCGKYFADEGCTRVITQAETIRQAAGHTLIHYPAKAPTEWAEGNMEYWACSICGRMFSDCEGLREVQDVTIPRLWPRPPHTTNPSQAGEKAFPFTDVPEDSWYYTSVRTAWEKGLIDGMTADAFEPEGTLTVAQAVKLAAVLFQMEHEGTVTLTNGGENWYDRYVDYAVDNGIIEEAYRRRPTAQMNAPATREEFVHIFHGAKETYAVINEIADNAIPDVKTMDQYASEIYEFYRSGILIGTDAKGTFNAASSIKRCEAAAILIRMFDPSVRKSITLN